MRTFYFLILCLLLVGCGPSKREVELEMQLGRTEQQLEKSAEIQADSKSQLETLKEKLSTAQD